MTGQLTSCRRATHVTSMFTPVSRSMTAASCACATRASSAAWASTAEGETGRFWGRATWASCSTSFGPEPLADDFSAPDFRRRLAKRKGRLKTLLMDQAFVAGVGNIYADEALWRAQLHPLRSAPP